MSFFNEMETIIKKHGEDGLQHLLHYYGMELELHRQVKNSTYSRVHGRDAGQPTKLLKSFKGVLESDDFFESNSTLTPAFLAGFLYTDSEDILIGDVIKIVSDHDRHKRYKVITNETIGLTTEVFKKYKLSALSN